MPPAQAVVAVTAAVTVAASAAAATASSVGASVGGSVGSTVGSGAGGGVAAGGVGTVLSLLVGVCQSAGTLGIIAPKGMTAECVPHPSRAVGAVVVVTSSCRGGGVIGRFKGFVNAFQFSNLGIDLGKINEAVFSPSDVAATVADAASGSNGWGTAAINLAAEASVPAKFYMPYVACLVAAAIAVVVAAELVCWCLAASCGCCVAKRARGVPGPSGGIALRSMTPSSTASVAGAPKSGGSHEEPRVEAGGASRKQVHGAQSKRNSIRWLRFKVRRELSVVPLCRSVSWAVLANVGER